MGNGAISGSNNQPISNNLSALKREKLSTSLVPNVYNLFNLSTSTKKEINQENIELIYNVFTNTILPSIDIKFVETNIVPFLLMETFPGGSIITAEGDLGNKMYIVESGELEVSIKGKVIKGLKSGDCFGEFSLLYESPRTATIKVVNSSNDCKLWSLNKTDFNNIKLSSLIDLNYKRGVALYSITELKIISADKISCLSSFMINKTYTIGKVYIQLINTHKKYS